jgi:hypothetical protein
MYDLNGLLGPDAQGWTVTAATGINNRGQIICNVGNSENQTRAAILTPVCNRAH